MIKEILKESLKITWHHPSLWFWGFLSTLILFSVNDLAFIFVSPSLFLNFSALEIVSSIKEPSNSISPFLILIISAATLLFLLFTTIAEIKIILTVGKLKNESKETKNSSKKIWSILFLRFLEALLFFIAWSPTFILINKININLLFLLLFLSSLLSLIILFVSRYTIFYILIKNNSFTKAIKNSFLFFKKTWLKTIKISFLLFIIVLIYGLIFFSLLGGGFITYPFRLVNLALTSFLGTPGFWISFILTAILVIFFQIILTGFIATYQLTSWLLFFLKSGGQPVEENSNKNFQEI